MLWNAFHVIIIFVHAHGAYAFNYAFNPYGFLHTLKLTQDTWTWGRWIFQLGLQERLSPKVQQIKTCLTWLPCDLALANNSGFKEIWNAVFESKWKPVTITWEFLCSEVTGIVSAAPFLHFGFFPKIIISKKKNTCRVEASLWEEHASAKVSYCCYDTLCEPCLFVVVGLELCSEPGKTSGFCEPGLCCTSCDGNFIPLKLVLEAYKSYQNAVTASTAQVDL